MVKYMYFRIISQELNIEYSIIYPLLQFKEGRFSRIEFNLLDLGEKMNCYKVKMSLWPILQRFKTCYIVLYSRKQCKPLYNGLLLRLANSIKLKKNKLTFIKLFQNNVMEIKSVHIFPLFSNKENLAIMNMSRD